jgi:excisionase family DNA binding protein
MADNTAIDGAAKPPTSADQLLTVAEIATILRMNQQTIRNWIDAGTLPAIRIGRRVRIRRADFNALVSAHPAGPGGTATTEAAFTAQDFWSGVEPPPSWSEG